MKTLITKIKNTVRNFLSIEGGFDVLPSNV